jgi:hypothetical protein
VLCRDYEGKPFPERLGCSPRAHGRKQTGRKRLYIKFFPAAIPERNRSRERETGAALFIASKAGLSRKRSNFDFDSFLRRTRRGYIKWRVPQFLDEIPDAISESTRIKKLSVLFFPRLHLHFTECESPQSGKPTARGATKIIRVRFEFLMMRRGSDRQARFAIVEPAIDANSDAVGFGDNFAHLKTSNFHFGLPWNG